MRLDEELKDLTDRLEKILHEELPEAARREIESDSPGSSGLTAVVDELDQVQRVLGLRTYELLRRLPPEGIGPVLANLPYTPGLSPTPPPGTPPPAVPDEVLIGCSYLNCPITGGITTCFDCSKPFCPQHLDPAVHPCGDMLV